MRLKIKQATLGDRPRGLFKFLLPDFLVGIFVAVSSDGMGAEEFAFRLAVVSMGVAFFTSLAETRKFFFSAGDMERFYFVRPTAASRFSSVAGITLLNLLVILSVFLPSVLLITMGGVVPASILAWSFVSLCASASSFFIFAWILSILPGRSADRILAISQLLMAFALLALFQLSQHIASPYALSVALPVSVGVLVLTSALFFLFPVSENLTEGLREQATVRFNSSSGLAAVLRRRRLINSGEEEAGFTFLMANLLRNTSFRLATIGIAGTPVVVAVYWTMQHARFLMPGLGGGLVSPELSAPISSLVVSGVVVYYFVSQNTLSARDYEAAWQFNIQTGFDRGRFVLGVRKALLLSVHVPLTLILFLVLLSGNSFQISLLTALTFYFLSHVAATWFSVMQKRFPFSMPFTQFGAIETVNLIFLLAFSSGVTIALYYAYGSLGGILGLNVFAFILVGILEFFSTRIVRKRLMLNA